MLMQCNVGNNEAGINSIIEQAQVIEGHAHGTALIDDGIHLLRTLILVLVYHQSCLTAGSFPVYSPEIITAHIIFYLLEFITVSDTSYLFYSFKAVDIRKYFQLHLFHL